MSDNEKNKNLKNENNEDNKDENNKISQAQDKMKDIKEFGNTAAVNPDRDIVVLSIIGQIEGHSVLPPQTKATKYEHIIPQLIDIEQNDKV